MVSSDAWYARRACRLPQPVERGLAMQIYFKASIPAIRAPAISPIQHMMFATHLEPVVQR